MKNKVEQLDIFLQIEEKDKAGKPYLNANGEPLPWEGDNNMLYYFNSSLL